MTNIRNLSKVDQPFSIGPDKVESVAPGETKSINVSEDRPDVVGRLHAGVIEIVRAGEDKAAPDANAKKSKAPEPTPAS